MDQAPLQTSRAISKTIEISLSAADGAGQCDHGRLENSIFNHGPPTHPTRVQLPRHRPANRYQRTCAGEGQEHRGRADCAEANRYQSATNAEPFAPCKDKKKGCIIWRGHGCARDSEAARSYEAAAAVIGVQWAVTVTLGARERRFVLGRKRLSLVSRWIPDSCDLSTRSIHQERLGSGSRWSRGVSGG